MLKENTKEIFVNKSQEQKEDKNIFEDMFKFAAEAEFNEAKIFEWIKKNGDSEDTRMRLWGVYISEIIKHQTISQIREEYICLKKL